MSLPVEVAHLEFGVVCTAHAELLADTRPDADALKQPVPVARKRFEVEGGNRSVSASKVAMHIL
jgi:hypothetical protein